MARRSHIREIEEQAALYALGALGPEEASGFRNRLSAGCPLRLSAFEECRTAVAALPLMAPEIAPPPELRQRLMERIAPVVPEEPVCKLVRPGDTPWES